MTKHLPEIVVAGHLCLDVLPRMHGPAPLPGAGELREVGDAQLGTGGAVGNVGLALHRLGHPVRLVGAVGDDGFGSLVRERLRQAGDSLDEHLQVHPGEPTSYSIVLSPPGIDRSFLHCPGVNHRFDPRAMSDDQLRGADLLHFGYPPLMRRVIKDGGVALADLFGRAKGLGLMTSLDLAMPDAQGGGSAVDWRSFLARVLPQVDYFVPSVDETRAVLGLASRPGEDESDLAELATQLMNFGTSCVLLKLGERGLYLRRGDAGPARRNADAAGWRSRELLARCFKVDVAGTTGSGDCTIAGFLSAVSTGASPESALLQATAVGACSVERSDATSGVPTLDSLTHRMAAHWARHAQPSPAGWSKTAVSPGLFAGPADVSSHQSPTPKHQRLLHPPTPQERHE